MPRPLKPLNPYASWSALFGATVQRLRMSLPERPPVTQADFGKRIGFAGSTVSAIERAQLRPDEQFIEGCERELSAGGILRAMFRFVIDEWEDAQRLGLKTPAAMAVVGPLDLVSSPLELADAAVLEALPDGMVAAMEVARHAEASDLGSGTLESLDRAVDRFCRDYPTASPAVLITQVQWRLGYVNGLLRGKFTLAQHRHLLVASGWLSVLLACLQFDLGDREAAEASRDAAYQLGKQTGHQEIMAWSYELLSWFALVDERFHDAVKCARAGLELGHGSFVSVQLAVQQAKAWARLGDASAAEDAMRLGASALSRLPVPEHPEHHLVFDAPKLSFYAATCYVWLGEPERAAEHAREVLLRCKDQDGTSPWPGRLAVTNVDLALIAFQRGDLDEACQRGLDALDLNSERLFATALGRFRELDGALRRYHATVSAVRDLHERIAVAHAALPASTSEPSS